MSEKKLISEKNAAVCKLRLALIKTITRLALYPKLAFLIFIRLFFIALANSCNLLLVEFISFQMVKTIRYVLCMMKNSIHLLCGILVPLELRDSCG